MQFEFIFLKTPIVSTPRRSFARDTREEKLKDLKTVKIDSAGSYPHGGVAGFVRSDIQTLRDQICSTHGPKVNCVMQVDF